MNKWQKRWNELKQVLVDARSEAFKESLGGDVGVSRVANVFYSTLIKQMEGMEKEDIVPKGGQIEVIQ